jgi:hypothetical protein
MSIVFIAIASLAGTACKKKEGEGGASGKSAEGAAKAGPTKLTKLNLQIDVPGEVEVSDGMSEGGQMLQGADIGAMEVSIPKTPQTIDEAKSDADMYTPKNLKTEKLADGWVISYDNTGSMGANYFATVRRDIGGKTYTCGTTTNEASRQAAVIAACKTLRP